MTYKLSLRFFTEEKAFGPGIAQLLHRVQELHSLRSAAADMGMAYSKAWTIVKNTEAALGYALLTSTTGGNHGGGAVLTPEGEALLRAYDTLSDALEKEADRLFAETLKTLSGGTQHVD